MKKAGQLLNNTGFSFLSNFIRLGTNFLIFVNLARVLSIEDFGIFTFSFTFAMLFMRVSDFGIDIVSVVDVSRSKALIKAYITNAFVVKAFVSAATFIIVWIIINAMGYPKNTKIIVYLLTIFVILQSYASFINGIFKGIERLEYETIVSFVINLLLLLLTFSSISLGYGVIGVGFSFIISRLIGFIFALGIFRLKVEKISFHFDYSFTKSLSDNLRVVF